MKKYISFIIFFIAFTGCNDFLSHLPDDRTTLNSAEKIKELLVSAYPEAHYMMFTELMSDNTSDKGVWAYSIYPRRQEEAYYWADATEESQDTPPFYWHQSYSAIAAANHALEAIEELNNSEECQVYKGEALFARAYAHFMLVNLWAEHYNPSTAETTLGVPYVTKPEKEALVIYERNTVAEVYRMVEDDLLKGYPLIHDRAYDVPKYHFNKNAANAFMTRFYLWKGREWDNVIKYATEILGNSDAWSEQMRDYAADYTPIAANTEQYRMRYTSVDESAILMLINASSIWYRVAGLSRYSMNNDVRKEIFENKPFSGSLEYSMYGSDPHYHLNKFAEYFKYAYPGASSGIPYVIQPAFTIEEVVFNRVEAFIMKGEYDRALNDINVFLSKRIKNYSASQVLTLDRIMSFYDNKPALYPDLKPYYYDEIDPTQMSLLKCLTDLRRKEFCQEGARWFDIKRFYIEIEHNIYGQNTGMKLASDDLRRVLQIPNGALSYGMQPNPR